MIRLEGLGVRAGDFLLSIEDLALPDGEYMVVLGPTAAGKTVLLETVAGLRRPQGGRIWLGDRDMTHEPPERRHTGLVYQDYALFPHLTVAENISFGWKRGRGRPRSVPEVDNGRSRAEGGDRRTEVKNLAALVGIDGLLERYPEGLSGGERQRVALARALAIYPAVLLLDEPLSALDGPTRLELRKELKRLHEQLGATVMHVTHDLDEALALGARVAVLIDGELRQVGDPLEVTRHPKDVEVARLVGAENIFPVAWISGEEGAGPQGRRMRVGLRNGLELPAPSQQAIPVQGHSYAVVRADEVTLEPARSSRTARADSCLVGTVSAVGVQSSHVRIEVTVASSTERDLSASEESASSVVFKVHVLRPELERKALAVGASVHVLIPSTAVHICTEGSRKEACARNAGDRS
jgi:ABC-type sugar transport system ATPase subunit